MNSNNKSTFESVVVTGSIAYDHIMSMPGKFGDHIMPDKIHMLNVSFFMESFRKEFGGTGGNIAYGLNLLDVPTILAGAVGHDFEPYQKHLEGFEMNLVGVKTFPKLATAQGFAMTDRDDNQIWGFYTGALRESAKVKIDKFLTKNSFLVIAPNDIAASMQYVKEAIKKNVPYMFDPAFNIAHFSDVDLAMAVENAAILIGNDYEMEMIGRRIQSFDSAQDKSSENRNQIRITTLGSKGSIIEDGDKKIKIKPAKVKNASDPTGAGDAFRAGFMAGYVRGMDLKTCGQMGSVSAAYTVENHGTQTHTFSKKTFSKRYRDNYGHNLII